MSPPPDKPTRKLGPLLELNLAVLLVAPAVVLGKLIDQPVEFVIWGRSVIGAIALLLIVRTLRGRWLRFDRRDWAQIAFAGILLAAHWISYFYAARISSVAVAMLALYTFPVITALLEPMFYDERWRLGQLARGLVVLLGVGLLAPSFNLGDSATLGVLIGVGSASMFAGRNLLNRGLVKRHDGMSVMAGQLLVMSLVLLPSPWLVEGAPSTSDWVYLLLLGLGCTSFAHTLIILSFRHLPVTTSSIVSSVQPVYGIIMGILIFNEVPTGRTLVGGAVILLAVVWESWSHGRQPAAAPTPRPVEQAAR